MPHSNPLRSPAEAAALRAFWSWYEPVADDVLEELRVLCLEMPAFAEIVRATPPDESRRRNARSLALQRGAILEDQWTAYLGDLREQGGIYARMGVGFGAWFDVTAAYRDLIRHRLVDDAMRDLDRARLVADGLNRLLDLAMCTIAEAYLDAKEAIIRDQQEAIREVSTPVLQVREQVLILPVVGVVDTHRARLITEAVLQAIRTRRARAVVVDITGVPIVDSKVARHIAQTCEAARLMGAQVVVTGISQQIAQTMVTIGADLADVRTLGDLQAGLEEVDRILAGAQRADASRSGARP
jgi:anti-anti-sigma factor